MPNDATNDRITWPVEYIRLTRDRYRSHGYDDYRWVHNDGPSDLVKPSKPLCESRVSVIVSGGAYVVGQVAFHYKDDTGMRMISKDVDTSDLRFSHVAERFLPDARAEPNCLVPINALARLERDGVVGEIVDPLISLMGGIYSSRKVREIVTPAILETVRDQGADAVLLIPMCPVCHQTMSMLARSLEDDGIPTTLSISALDIVQSVKPPRAAFIDYPLGHTAGKPNDPEDQYEVLKGALGLLETVTEPGTIVDMGRDWDDIDPDWKDKTINDDQSDTRGARDETPRYQYPEDKVRAEQVA
ncbi:MAG: hypothetical protein CMM61_10050 [Rhodospirillaceae bacterium]|nr:hypothetical protein [Rhodospirillaceae bacterium]